MKPLQFLVIGCGNRGEAYADYSLYYPNEMRIAGAADPNKEKLDFFSGKYKAEKTWPSWKQALQEAGSIDAVIIATPDQTHYEIAMKCLEADWPILLEKPIAVSAADCISLAEKAEDRGVIVAVGHVLRYAPFFRKVKEVADSGILGTIATIELIEPVRYWHQAHSFVRGNWRKSDESAPMILAKSCHDMDIIRWIAGSRCSTVSSFGSLLHFTRENAPEGSRDRCIDGCSAEQDCPYSAMKLYLDPGKTGWPVTVLTKDLSVEGRIKALKEGPYGRCVYRCENDVVDHQVVAMEFEGGTTGSFTMTAFTGSDTGRRIRVMGTLGELRGEDEKIEVTTFKDDRKSMYTTEASGIEGLRKHGGGDFGLIRDFIRTVRGGDPGYLSSTIQASLESHLMAFAAEKSRLEKRVISL